MLMLPAMGLITFAIPFNSGCRAMAIRPKGLLMSPWVRSVPPASMVLVSTHVSGQMASKKTGVWDAWLMVDSFKK